MTLQVLDIVDGNAFDAAKEKATGTDGVIIKAGQGKLEYRWKIYADQCESAGLPWGVYWVVDARYSPESHKAAIKLAFPTGYFGKLGMWLDVEKPVTWWPDWLYRAQPYAYYKPIESIWRGVQAYSGTYPGWYTSAGAWDLICPAMPLSLQQEIASKCDLWIANYGVSTPKMRGAWGKWVMWQYQEGPDYSVVNQDWWDLKFGPAIPPEPIPVPEPNDLKSVAITVRSERAELASVSMIGAASTLDVTSLSTLTISPFPVTPPPSPTPTPGPAPVPDRPGELMDLKVRRTEYMKLPPLTVGSFAQLGGRGQDNWLELGRAEIRFIQNWVHNADLWNWAASEHGDIYTARDDAAGTVKWPFVLMSSCFGQPRQFARVGPAFTDRAGTWRRVYGIPFQANGDYSEFTPDKYPEYFLWCPTIYPDDHVGWESHNGMLFIIPVFDAATWPDSLKSGSAKDYGGAVDADIFLGPHT